MPANIETSRLFQYGSCAVLRSGLDIFSKGGLGPVYRADLALALPLSFPSSLLYAGSLCSR
jgi:hypothetical protein